MEGSKTRLLCDILNSSLCRNDFILSFYSDRMQRQKRVTQMNCSHVEKTLSITNPNDSVQFTHAHQLITVIICRRTQAFITAELLL